MQGTGLKFKGLKKGLYALYEGTDSFEDFLRALEAKLKDTGDFFAGACLAGVYGIELDEIEEDILAHTLEGKFGMRIKRPIISRKAPFQTDDDNGDTDTMFIYSTLRSGQRIACEGNVVVLGDVNAGAEIEAGGNVVIMGTLRGSVRAGVPDNYGASVSAIVLKPTQLWIGDVAVRWPDEERYTDGPEMAYIEQGKMYVRSVNDNK